LGAICLLIFHFGWAKPVPVNTSYFENRRRDIILMALSGPVANISAAFVAGLFIRHYDLDILLYQFYLRYIIILNVGLGLFNLLPIPPLDGSHVLENLLPTELRKRYLKYAKYAPYLLIGIILADNFLHTGILESILGTPIKIVVNFFGGKKIL
jgi:Zn-dependent protease